MGTTQSSDDSPRHLVAERYAVHAVDWSRAVDSIIAECVKGSTAADDPKSLQRVWDDTEPSSRQELIDSKLAAFQDQAAIHVMALYGLHRCVEWLIVTGRANLENPNPWGLSALYLACEFGHVKAAAVLINRGNVDMNAHSENGWAPIHVAVYCLQEPIVRYLLSVGADPQLLTTRTHEDIKVRSTCMDIADKKGHSELVELLRSFQRLTDDHAAVFD